MALRSKSSRAKYFGEPDPAEFMPPAKPTFTGMTYAEAVACAKQLRVDQGREGMLAYLEAHR